MQFKNAQQVFEYYYNKIIKNGIDFNNTKALMNQGFTILNPEETFALTELVMFVPLPFETAVPPPFQTHET